MSNVGGVDNNMNKTDVNDQKVNTKYKIEFN